MTCQASYVTRDGKVFLVALREKVPILRVPVSTLPVFRPDSDRFLPHPDPIFEVDLYVPGHECAGTVYYYRRKGSES